MTTRTPDFYRVVLERDGVRRFLNHGYWDTSRRCGNTWPSESEAIAAAKQRGEGRVVPVYVKVTRKPKLHDFGWALRRMREGKAVRRACWEANSYAHSDRRPCNVGGGVLRGVMRHPQESVLTWETVNAQDWTLSDRRIPSEYEPEVGS